MKNLNLLLQQIKLFLKSHNEINLRLRLQGSCLKQEDTTLSIPKNVVNLFID